MKQTLSIFSLAAAMFLMSSCQKVDINDEEEEETTTSENAVTLKVNISHYEQMAFSDNFEPTKAVPIKNLCKRISLGLYQNGELVTKKNQYPTSPNLGKFELSVEPGNYQLLIFAHNNDTTATITKPHEISFSPKKVTDTFINYQQLNIAESTTLSLTVDRVVAMFRLCSEDNLPESVASISIKYTGGSSTLDATTGYGCVNSRQEEKFTMTDAMHGSPVQLEVYTFPRQDSNMLNVTVTCFDGQGNTLCSQQLKEVPIAKNQITQCKTKLFSEITGGETPETPGIETNDTTTVEILANGEWNLFNYFVE